MPAAAQKFANNASSTLSGVLAAGDASLSVANGSAFPNPGAGQFFMATIQNASGTSEIVKVTIRTGDTFAHIVRAQEGTASPANFAIGDRVELRNTAASLGQMIQRTGDTMSGDLDMGNNNLLNAVLGAGSKVASATEISNTPMRSAAANTNYQLAYPAPNAKAQMGGKDLLTTDDLLPVNTIIMWYGGMVAGVPSPITGLANWHECDGTNGTPDLRGRAPVGVSPGTLAQRAAVIAKGGVVGGDPVVASSTSSNGSHSHGGGALPHVLDITELPLHKHLSGVYVGAYAGTGAGGAFPSAWNGFGGATSRIAANGHANSLYGQNPPFGGYLWGAADEPWNGNANALLYMTNYVGTGVGTAAWTYNSGAGSDFGMPLTSSYMFVDSGLGINSSSAPSSGQSHNHGLNADGAHTHTVAPTEDPKIGVYFIMKIS